MAILEIPVRSDLPAYSFVVELDQSNYLLKLRWNSREELWFMDIATTEDVAVLSGVPLLVDSDLIGRFKSENLPPGLLMIYDRSGSGTNPARDNLGTDFLLLYEEAVS